MDRKRCELVWNVFLVMEEKQEFVGHGENFSLYESRSRSGEERMNTDYFRKASLEAK
jgi:hypothetical protein